MKLRKILAGFLAGAVAMSSMVVTASAGPSTTPTEGEEVKIFDMLTTTTILYDANGSDGNGTNAWNCQWVQASQTDQEWTWAEVLAADNTYLKLTYSMDEATTTNHNTAIAWGIDQGWWDSSTGGDIKANNVPVYYNSSNVTANTEVSSYIPASDLGLSASNLDAWGQLGFNIQSNMVGGSITVTNVCMVEYVIPSYAITSSQTDGGSFAVTLNNDPYSTEVITEAEAGDDVYIFFNPNIGYELTAYMIMGRSTGEYYANENSDESEYVSDVESITFDMPEEPVAIVAYFGKALYDVYVLPCENGTVFADNPTALYGDEIKITATPSSGYEVSSIVVKDTTGKTIATTDTFLMPDSHVTVEVTFTATGAEDDFTATAIDLGAPDSGWNATFDDATDTINMSEAWGVMYWNNIGDCSDYSKVVLKYSDSTFDNILLTVTYSDDTQDFQSATGANGEITLELDDAKKSGVFNINIGGNSIPGSIKIISIELIPEPMFNKTATEFEAADAGKIVSQTAIIDGKVAKRFTMLVGLDAIKKATKVEFTLSNGTETKVYTTDKYYTSLTASGEEVTAPEGYGFVTLTITDIPDGVTVTCTGIELIIPAN